MGSRIVTDHETIQLPSSFYHRGEPSPFLSPDSLSSSILLRSHELAIRTNRFLPRRTLLGTTESPLEPPQIPSSDRRSIAPDPRTVHPRTIAHSLWSILEQVPFEFRSSSEFPLDLGDHFRDSSRRSPCSFEPLPPFQPSSRFSHFRPSLGSIHPRYDSPTFSTLKHNSLSYMVH